MSDPKDPQKPGATVWDRMPKDSEASAGYDLVANIIVGLGLGWLVQHFWPGCKPWGYAGGVLLGSVAGFYQLFKMQNRNRSGKKKSVPKDGRA
jgi:F0F1-type ATP synthase assembly protein I